MKRLKNIGPDERTLQEYGVQLAQGAEAEIGTGKGQVPEHVARELANDEPGRYAIVEDKPAKAGKADA